MLAHHTARTAGVAVAAAGLLAVGLGPATAAPAPAAAAPARAAAGPAGPLVPLITGDLVRLGRSSLFDPVGGSNGFCGEDYLCTGLPGYDAPTGIGTPNGLGAF